MDYKRKIIEMLNKINDEKTLSFIYKIISNLLGFPLVLFI